MSSNLRFGGEAARRTQGSWSRRITTRGQSPSFAALALNQLIGSVRGKANGSDLEVDYDTTLLLLDRKGLTHWREAGYGPGRTTHGSAQIGRIKRRGPLPRTKPSPYTQAAWQLWNCGNAHRGNENAPLDMHLHLTIEILMQRSTSYWYTLTEIHLLWRLKWQSQEVCNLLPSCVYTI